MWPWHENNDTRSLQFIHWVMCINITTRNFIFSSHWNFWMLIDMILIFWWIKKWIIAFAQQHEHRWMNNNYSEWYKWYVVVMMKSSTSKHNGRAITLHSCTIDEIWSRIISGKATCRGWTTLPKHSFNMRNWMRRERSIQFHFWVKISIVVQKCILMICWSWCTFMDDGESQRSRSFFRSVIWRDAVWQNENAIDVKEQRLEYADGTDHV